MHAKFSPFVQKELLKTHKKDKQLAEKIEKRINLFESNPKHPSLRVHKLKGELDELWSISITKSIRMTYMQEEDIALFIDIGTHDEVYKK